MTITLADLCEKLKQVDEVTLLEKLEIYSDEVVDRFLDRIEEKFEELISDFEDEFDE